MKNIINNKNIVLGSLVLLLVLGCSKTNIKTDSIYKYKIPLAGQIKPSGWIKAQMARDLNEGYYGKYDGINTTVSQTLFKEHSRKRDANMTT